MAIRDPQRRKEVISCLCDALKDPDSNVRCAAAKALGKFNTDEIEEFVPQIVEASRDKDATVRREVIEALGEIGGRIQMHGDQTFNINSVGNLNARESIIQGNQIGIQNDNQIQQDFEFLLADFQDFVIDLANQHPTIDTSQSAAQVITVEAKKIKPTRLQNFLELRRLWNGGKKAAIRIGEHFSENNVWVKGALAFLEGISEG